MKQKKLNDILYVFDITPYVITQDTDADVIKVQQECYEGYVELNPDLASKIVKYNYHMFTVSQQEWAPYVDADDKPSPELAWSAASATVTIGADDNIFPTLSNPHNITSIYYESSNTSIAEINNYGEITLVAEGNTTISAVFAGNDDYAAQTVTYALTVQQAQPQPLPSPELAWSEESATVTIGADDNVFPTLSNPHSVDVHYVSGDTEKATIDSSTGVITLIAEGTSWITAEHVEGGDEYAYGRADYLLTIQQAQPQPSTITVTAPNGLDIFDETISDWVSMTPVGGDSYATEATGTLTTGNSYSVEQRSGIGQGAEVTFSPSCGTGQQGTVGAEFVAPNQDLTITLSQPQPQTITVTAPYGLMIYDEQSQQQVTMTPVGDSEPTEATGTLTVGVQYEIEQGMGAGQNKWPRFSPSCSTGTYGGSGEVFTAPATDLTITLLSYPDMRYTPNAATVTIGDPNNVFPTLSNPNNYTITYSSNNISVATVDQSTGVVTLVAAGNANINAMTTGYSGPAQGTGYPLTVNAGDSNPE